MKTTIMKRALRQSGAFLAAALTLGVLAAGALAGCGDDVRLSSIAVAPTTMVIARGTTQQFSATGTYSDGSKRDLTALVTWTTADPTVATVASAEGSQGLASGVGLGSVAISAELGDRVGSASLRVKAAALTSISVGPAGLVMSAGDQHLFVTTGSYSDGSTADLSGAVSWAVSDQSVATVVTLGTNAGLVTAVAGGSATITVGLGSLSARVKLTVIDPALTGISVGALTASVGRGGALQLTATGSYANSTSRDITALVTWRSSDESVATISNAPGQRGFCSSLSKGRVTITATLGDQAGRIDIAVIDPTLIAISLDPADPVMATGDTVQFTATGLLSDGSTVDLTSQAAWTTTDETVATISNDAGSLGLCTMVGPGAVTISAAVGDMSADTTLMVN